MAEYPGAPRSPIRRSASDFALIETRMTLGDPVPAQKCLLGPAKVPQRFVGYSVSCPVIRGVSLFHFHLLKHEDKGMMAKILFQ